MKPSLRILAVDDHQLFLHGLSECLKSFPAVEEVVTCTSYEVMNTVLTKWTPDIVFLDLNLGNYDGFEICAEIKSLNKQIFVAILTQYDLDKFIDKGKSVGAGAYFIKNTDTEILDRFITDFSLGKIKEYFVHAQEGTQRRADLFKNDSFELKGVLSKRELEVMKLLIKGWDHAEIEKSLNITYDTFKCHRSNILQKLNKKNVAELILFSFQHNISQVS